MGTFIDRTGKRYGQLVCSTYLGSQQWRCICDCGRETTVKSGHLHSGNTQSCGCRKAKVLGESTTKHGKAGTRVYRIWKAMMTRCYNKNSLQYSRYGGRGVRVGDAWHEFANFYADMGDPPEKLTLDRVNNELSYSKENCRWATVAQQNNNQRRSLRIDGVTPKQWAAAHGVSYGTAYRKAKMVQGAQLASPPTVAVSPR